MKITKNTLLFFFLFSFMLLIAVAISGCATYKLIKAHETEYDKCYDECEYESRECLEKIGYDFRNLDLNSNDHNSDADQRIWWYCFRKCRDILKQKYQGHDEVHNDGYSGYHKGVMEAQISWIRDFEGKGKSVR